MPELRPFQSEDVAAVLAAHAKHQCVIGRAATGLGKAVELAALAAHYSQFGRVMVLVDVTKLVRQLADTIKWFTGVVPGIEMADETASNGNSMYCVAADKIIVSTVQTQYSGGEDRERYRRFDPDEFSCILLDECELFLAPKARSVVAWYQRNEKVRIYGCTATPFRSDGVAMADLFEHVAFNRDIRWGVAQGWLTRVDQKFVRTSLDFSTLKTNVDDEGESDFSADDLAEKINNDRTLMEIARGTLEVAGDRRTIIVCPNVAMAEAVAQHLDGLRPGCAKCIYGTMTDEQKDAAFSGHREGKFQFLASVMMLTKGYDDDRVACIVNLRKTKSKRLYQQILGRATRVLKGLVEGMETPEERRAAIAASSKPVALMADLVGVERSVRQVSVIDILGTPSCETVAEMAQQFMLDDETMSMEDAEAKAEEVVEMEQEAVRAAAEAEEQRKEDEFYRKLYRAHDIKVNVEVQDYDDDSSFHVADKPPSGLHHAKHLNILRKAKLTDAEIAAIPPEQAGKVVGEIIRRWKAGLCSWRQAKALQRAGYSKDELREMTRETASAAMDEVKANGWKRPTVEVGQ